jgi:anti-sigma factor RsiW
MTCDAAIEALPWLLNGTLGEDERAAVREHLESCERCREALADTRRVWEIFDQHIPAAALVAHAAGETPDGIDPEVFAEHLAACPECAAELELVRMSRGLAEDDAVALLAPRPPGAPASARPVRPAALRWRRAAVAAGLAGVVALGGWYKSAERAHTLADRLATTAALARPPAPAPSTAGSTADAQRLAELERQVDALRASESQVREQLAQAEKRTALSGPQVNTWSDDVQASEDVVRGRSAVKEVPAGTTATLLLRPNPSEVSGSSDGRDLEIDDAAGKTLWKGRGLRINPQGPDYSLTIPAGWLRPGDYTIRLYRQDGRRSVPTESYAIRIR